MSAGKCLQDRGQGCEAERFFGTQADELEGGIGLFAPFWASGMRFVLQAVAVARLRR